MRRLLTVLLMSISCIGCDNERAKIDDVKLEMLLLLGENTDCDNVVLGEGFLCKSETGRNYYCPKDSRKKCFFTARLLLVDKPAEKVPVKPPLTQ